MSIISVTVGAKTLTLVWQKPPATVVVAGKVCYFTDVYYSDLGIHPNGIYVNGINTTTLVVSFAAGATVHWTIQAQYDSTDKSTGESTILDSGTAVVPNAITPPVDPPPPYVPPQAPTPPAVTGLAYVDTTTAITLRWTAVPAVLGTNASYAVFRGSVLLGTTSGTSFTDGSCGSTRPLTYSVVPTYSGNGATYGGSSVGPTAAITTNSPPYAPTPLAPISGTIDRTMTQRFSWVFTDPDASDSQSAYDLQWSVDGGTSWTTVAATSPNTFYDLPPSTLPAGSGTLLWRVRAYDSLGLVGPYSATATTSYTETPAAPTITYPANNGTIERTSYITWQNAHQSQFQIVRCADLNGAPDLSTIYFDTGAAQGQYTTRRWDLSSTVNNRYEHIRLRATVNGVWSAWADVRVLVFDTPPAPPTATLLLDSAEAALAVSWVTASGSTPPTYCDVLVTTDYGNSSEVYATHQPTNGTWTFWTPASAVDYGVQVVAHAANGTSAASGWVY